jgi:predicted ATP-binding protein involved in virulence
MPIVSQNGFEVSLDKLSSGNLYLIQRIISLLGQMYSVYVLNDLKLEEMLLTPGLLLIDEAENHLHPKWQKTFLNSILDIFPNLQIIITTHSPFIVSSVENSKVFVCKSEKDHSVIVDETDVYSNKPIEEILQSEVFNTNPFNAEISDLMNKRKVAIETKDFAKKEEIEEKLKVINPEYFSYFDIDKLIKSISK